MISKFQFRAACCALAATALSACSAGSVLEDAALDDGAAPAAAKPFRSASGARECLMRAMYFESIRSSKEGLLAVGTVVMNRVESPKFPSTVCGVVGQRKQFAPGVMTRKMRGNTAELADLADEILAGKRHPGVKRAKFFHQAGLRFPYKNMHYVLKAGGNEFYEKRSRKRRRKS